MQKFNIPIYINYLEATINDMKDTSPEYDDIPSIFF